MDFLFSQEGRNKIKQGIDTTANAIKVTLGAKGRNVIIRTSNNRPYITKDGVTVANSIYLKDPVEDMGATLVKEAAIKTVEQAGDGTTTVSVLLQALVDKCNEQLMKKDVNILELKKGVEDAVVQTIQYLKENSIKVENIDIVKNIATISANNDEFIGELLFNAFSKVGKNGYVTIEESNNHETSVSITEGLMIDRGYIRYDFITNVPKMRAELNDVKILIVEKVIQNPTEIQGILNEVVKLNKSLLLIADDIQGGALEFIALNKQRGTLKACIIKSPSFGEEKSVLLRDIALCTGATVISDATGMHLDKVQFKHLGTASKVICEKNTTYIIDGKRDIPKYTETTKELETLIKDNNDSKDRDIEFAKIRLAKLQNNMATIKVGGVLETEMRERKDRIDDAVSATKSAIEEGYIAGGGSSLLRASDSLKFSGNKDYDLGVDIVKYALLQPFYQILKNAGVENIEEIAEKIKKTPNLGYNAKTNNIEDLLESGVVDPIKVIRVALENASSSATMFLISECVIY